MSFAYMPIYTGDYHRDTRHLTPEEHGIYMLLLMHCWDQKGPVPLDERRQCGLVNARSGGEIESMRRVLLEFFTRMEDGWYNKRMTEEITKAEMISGHRRAGALEKARRHRDALHHAQAVLKQSKSSASAGTPTPILTTTKESKPTVRSAHDAPPGFVSFWNAFPATRRRVAKSTCLAIWQREHCEAIADQIVGHVQAMAATPQWKDGYEPAPKTYLNQKRWNDELPVMATAKKVPQL